jgi:hypothetical protein
MIDTVEIKHFRAGWFDEADLLRRGATPLPHRFLRKYAINPPRGEPLPKVTVTLTHDALTHIAADFNPARLLRGHNAKLPDETEVWDGMKIASEYVENILHIPFSAKESQIAKVHFAKDLLLGEDKIVPAIAALASRNIPRFLRRTVSDTTVYFDASAKTNKTQIRVYSKLAEVIENKRGGEAAREARGKLRVEFAVQSKRTVLASLRRYGIQERSADSVLRQSVSDRFTASVIKELGIGVASTSEPALVRLRRFFSAPKAFRLAGFLEARRIFGSDFYKDPVHGVSRTAYMDAIKECRRAGVCT